ncbi:hypothetical protein LQV63_05830 [Paenibacillus profundus]|uniref:Pyridoxamine 5'-phosphate oxidase n=1 Tax=Paenibacillus profundus TaxID=1173085 RepID=A0ABS8YD69_9BACL|nr:hypothetical protein [Paenibacillus profundus]MCE5168829.1 hypothetical protein [Paenibacillus profundus]
MNNPNELLRSLKSLSGPFPPFDVTRLPESPGALFLQWLNLAIKNEVKEPHAMTLTSVFNITYATTGSGDIPCSGREAAA